MGADPDCNLHCCIHGVGLVLYSVLPLFTQLRSLVNNDGLHPHLSLPGNDK